MRVAAPIVVALLCCRLAMAVVSIEPVQGLRQHKPGLVALTGATVVTAPGKVLAEGVVVIDDGRILAVGAGVTPPEGARVIDLSGKTLYPGFIDAYTEVDVQAPPPGPAHWNKQATPQRAVAASYKRDAKLAKELRAVGVAARLAAPKAGVIKGVSCLVLTGDDDQSGAIVQEATAQHLSLTIRTRRRDAFPNSPMGAVALARQTLLDAQWHRQAKAAASSVGGASPVAPNAALDALGHCLEGGQLVIADADNETYVLRADRFAREFALRLAVCGSGNEYRRLDAIAATGRPLIVPVDFPKPPPVASPAEAADATLEELLHWRLAPENPARLHKAGVAFALTTHGLKKRSSFLKQVRTAVKRGLPVDAALAALTTAPAELLGVAQAVGTIAPKKLANLVVADGELFTSDAKVLAVWVAGKRYATAKEPDVNLLGKWPLQLANGPDLPALRLEFSGKPAKPTGKLALAAAEPDSDQDSDDDDKQDAPDTTKLKELKLRHERLSARVDGKLLDREGAVLVSATALTTDSGVRLVGELRPVGGEPIRFTATRDETDNGEQDEKEPSDAVVEVDAPVNYPLGAYGRAAPPERPEHVLFRGATVWTCDDAGRLADADVLVTDGRIAAVGQGITPPAGAVVVDAEGKHLTPGIIDCHSHMATDGGINESSQAITAEVRIADFIDPDDITLYRQLAGGVTTSNILHGSANPIGGQNQVIKLRWGALAEELKFAGAPAGIKWALGENVKQSNWGDDHRTRYPQTRMGVDELHTDALNAARAYRAKHDAWAANPVGPPPRRDLELEALAEILAGERWIHCHSYRQSEILSLLRTLESFGVTIGSLQHILEGYKVAPEMAAHGAMGSSFADWWAYKYEVYDAIPFNGALMHRAGVVVSFNSDDAEMGRHLNHEAAKAVKYGGVPADEALKFVTLNAAKQLRIEDRVGSLAPGKDADLVLWSGPPLSTASRCEQTWIDGRKYFDIDEDRSTRAANRRLHSRLVQAVFDSKQTAAKPGENRQDPSHLWPRHDEFCHGHGHSH